MEKASFRGARQLIRKASRLLGRHIQAKDFDRDETVPCRLVGAEDRTEGANTNLMQDPEWAKRWRGGECGRVVSGQEPCSSGDRKNLAQFCTSSFLARGYGEGPSPSWAP